MLRFYLSIALRGFKKNLAFTIINIGGFAIALTTCMLIVLWVVDEYSYDDFHVNYDRIYKVYHNEQDGQGNTVTRESVPFPARAAMLEKTHLIEFAVSTSRGEPYLLQAEDNKINKRGLSVTEDFFKIFTFEILAGSTDKALLQANNIILTRATAVALFGDHDPINQLVRVNNNDMLKVAAVIKDVPAQSIFHFDFVLPMSYFEKANAWVREQKDDWNYTSPRVYLLLKDPSNADDAGLAIRDLMKERASEGFTDQLFIAPISKWRLDLTFEDGKAAGGQIIYVRLFSAIACFVLVIACFNFMNLSTAQSIQRAQEVAIRKCLGSSRKQLIIQFLGESTICVAIAFLLAVSIVQLTLPAFNLMVDKHITLQVMNPTLISYSLVFIGVMGVLTGSYPAFLLSSFVPARVLKSKSATDRGAASLRRVLVTFQFGLSIFLCIITTGVYQQVVHSQQRDLGFDRHHLIQLRMNAQMNENFEVIQQELMQSGIASAITKTSDPITKNTAYSVVMWPGNEQGITATGMATGYNFLPTILGQLTVGRSFSPEFNDSSSVIVNETAARLIGADVLGFKVNSFEQTWTVVGVFKDIVMDSPLQSVEPMLVYFVPKNCSTMLVRLNSALPISDALSQLQHTLIRLNPDWPADYTFADEEYGKKSSRIDLTGRLAILFSVLAISITCLGLLGLAAFCVQQRVKELGIRKVFGATVRNLVLLISNDFMRMVAIGFAIAAPVSWWCMNQFLQQYSYRTVLGWWVFPTAGLVIAALTVSIVGAQALKVARTNPCKTLNPE